jgi:FAD/FMN-containing dehydrogenase/Fe-S oxidoreductase
MPAALSPKVLHLFEHLRESYPGDVAHDDFTRGIYATDASIYQQMPAGLFTPPNREAVSSAVRLAAEHGVPVLARGGGTSLAGQTTAQDALVVDVSRHMDKLLEVNEAESWALVQPGLVRDNLNALIANRGLMFAPETSTSNRAAIGGMIGNNSSGMMSIRYGTTISHVLGLEAVLADGTITWFGTRSEMDERGRALLDGLMAIVNRNRALIEELFPKVIRRVGGYSLDAFLGNDPNLAKILVGSEGTLALMTAAKVKLVPKPKVICAVAVHFADLLESLRATPLMVKHNPLSAEFMDGPLIRMCLENATTKPLMGWLRGNPEAVIAVEFDGNSVADCEAAIDALIADLKAAGYGYEYVKLLTPKDRSDIVETRKHGLGVMLREIGDRKAISFIEDACVPVEHLADYTAGIIDIVRSEGLELMSYGHASVGVLHLKPVVNLKSAVDRAKCERISERAMALCKQYKGSWSGEHGDGIARGAQNALFWGAEMMEVFREVKRLFDPQGILNPGKIFDTPPVMGPLRYTGNYKQPTYKSMFHFREDGGFSGAVEMCNGVGACRKINGGTMCPSYQATREEKDTTRARANALRLAMSGQMGPEGLANQGLYDVLDLCLECKACKTECPSNVDMARMKSEFLHAWHQEKGVKLRERVFANSPKMARLQAGPLAPVVNFVLGLTPVRRLVNGFLGVAVERELPTYASETFATWFKRRPKPTAAPSKGKVVLFDDTYVNYHEPHNGQWAVRVLEHLGYEVVVANAGCCCRPAISKGFLDQAKREGEQTLRKLDVYAREGLTIVTLEPSCCSSLNDDLPDLIDDVELGQRMKKAVMPIEAFLEAEHLAGRIKWEPADKEVEFLLHGHCHQKALHGTSPLKRLLSVGRAKSPVREIDSGCCGMAGSFGYEQEHYELSQKIGEQRLFPEVRAAAAETVVIADGFSCRHQISDGTGRKPVHFIEAFGRALLGERKTK